MAKKVCLACSEVFDVQLQARMVGLRNVLTMCPEMGKFDLDVLPSPRKDVCESPGLG